MSIKNKQVESRVHELKEKIAKLERHKKEDESRVPELIESQELRKDFSKIPQVLDIPHLLDVQIRSYKDFLQADIPADERSDTGLHGAFKSVFPLEDYNGKASLEYLSYRLDEPKYDFAECRLKGYTYTAPLYVTFRLIIWDIPESEKGHKDTERQFRDIKEQEIYFGEVQLMTPSGSFIVNGTERVIVNQLHRSPGVFFDRDKSKSLSGKEGSFIARIVPQNGRWLDFEYDLKDMLHVRIDRKKKFHVTVLLKAMGYDEQQIMDFFYPVETFHIEPQELRKEITAEVLDVSDKQEFESRIRELREEIAKLESDKQEFESRIRELKGVEGRRRKLREKIAKREKKLVEHRKKLAEIEGQKKGREKKLAELEEQKKGHEKKLAELEGQKKGHEKKLAELEGQKKGHEKKLAELEGQKKELEGKIAAGGGSQEREKKVKEFLQIEKNARKIPAEYIGKDPWDVMGLSHFASREEIEGKHLELAEYHPDRHKDKKKADAHFTEINWANDLIRDIRESYPATFSEDELKRLKKELTKVKSLVNKHNKKLAEIEKKKKEVESSIRELREEIANLERDKKEDEGRVHELKEVESSIHELREEIANLERDKKEDEGRIHELREKIANLERDKKEDEGRIHELREKIAEHEEKLAKLERTAGFKKKATTDIISYQKVTVDINHPETGELVGRKGRRLKNLLPKLQEVGMTSIPVSDEEIMGKPSAEVVFDPETGEVVLDFNEEITEEKLNEMCRVGKKTLRVYYIDKTLFVSSLRTTLVSDKVDSCEEAITEIYKKFRPTDPPSAEVARAFFENMFFTPDAYRLSKVGRIKINYKLKRKGVSDDHLTLDREDILLTVKYLLDLKGGRGSTDDIDHLGNRRVRTVGELIEDRFYHGLERLARFVKEKMGYQTIENLMPNEVLVPKTVTSVLKEFFTTGQLSQFMDQTNPLSEITHKRRLSALGPGGLTRERAGFEVRDVHSSHYGRICPIETPEGPNIGLISSLSTYAKIDESGFIRTPYRKVKDGRVTDEIVYMNALMEEDYIVAQANAPLEEDGSFKLPFVSARGEGEFMMVEREKVEFMDVSPSQLVSVSASLIPFLEHDDANRALMGSNMQRQAVPLIKSVSPLVGTGFESKVAKDSGVTVVARRDGIVESVDAVRIVVKSTERSREGGVDIYNLIKFHRSNQSSCWNQNPIVRKGQQVKKGQVIADGCSTDRGELALGQNMVVAFMPWGGYNFEDAILISERVVKDDAFTSIHIEEFECTARETKLGREDITRDIPNVSEESLRNLDESGIIMIGAEVEPGDILVGKISPKAETQLSPEERLLRAIFGDKAGDVKDSSLKVSSGVYGTVIDVETLVSRSVDKDERSKDIENEEIAKLKEERDNEVSILRRDAVDRAKHIVLGRISLSKITVNRKTVLKSGQEITEEILDTVPLEKLVDVRTKDPKTALEADEIKRLKKELPEVKNSINENKKKPDQEEELTGIISRVLKRIDYVSAAYEQRIEKLKKPDELPPGVLRVVKVRIAVKRKLQVGDKMAGRHGNKGVVSKILPQEDMPYLSDGRPVDMVLNPLGVPSRMNVGQILETHLGWGGRELGRQLNEYIEQEFNDKALREKLLEIYSGSSQTSKLVESLDREGLVEMVRELEDGVPVKSPVFDGAHEAEIARIQELAGIDKDGKTILFDGQTGEPFDQKVCVGIMYMLKLHHLVEEKIHARAIGPYSLVTQQPLGGKAHFGGQRLGEMEVWALEAYGAAYTLQEFVTIKSDDVAGRTRIFDSIVRGNMNFEPGLPESFKVLRKELQALGLDVDLIEQEAEIEREAGTDLLPK